MNAKKIPLNRPETICHPKGDSISLFEAIAAYRAGNAAYSAIPETMHEALGGDDAVGAMTYQVPMERLQEWSAPATSFPEAMSALELALEEEREAGRGEGYVVYQMLQAALIYLRSAGGIRENPGAHLVENIAPVVDVGSQMLSATLQQLRAGEVLSVPKTDIQVAYEAIHEVEAVLSLSLSNIERISDHCTGDPIIRDVQNLQTAMFLIMKRLGAGLDILSEIESGVPAV